MSKTEQCLKNLSSLKFRVYTKYDSIYKDLTQAMASLPEDVTDSFEKVYEHFNVSIKTSTEFEASFRQLLWSVYYDMHIANVQLPKDSMTKVVALIKRNPDAYPKHLLKYLKGKILSFDNETLQIEYCINMVYKHLKYVGIDQYNLPTIFNVPNFSFTAFAFSVAGRLMELAILDKIYNK